MIASALLAAAALVAAPFAPPPDTLLRYRTVDTRPMRTGGEVSVTLDQTLRIARVDGALEATLVATGHMVAAPAPFRAAFDLLFAGFDGIPTRVRLGRGGAIAGVVGGAETWTAIRDSQAAMVARIGADPAIGAAEKARIGALSAEAFDLAPAARDARLADSFTTVLAPPLPALAEGEARPFRAEVPGPGGALASGGTAMLVRGDAATLVYRIETRSDPGATAPAVAALLAKIGPDVPPAERARAEAAIETLRGAVYLERSDIVVERATGLLLRLHAERAMEDAGHARHATRTIDVTRLSAIGYSSTAPIPGGLP